SVRHITKFRYKPAVRESVMEVRMQPRSDEGQRCLSFSLDVRPAAAVMQYRDFLGNIVHHFDIAGSHAELRLKAQALVDVLPAPNAFVAAERTWDDLDQMVATGDYWEMMLPSAFAHSTPLLEKLASEMKLERRGTPLELLLEISQGIHDKFAYVPNSTGVDSPIDDALRERK
ncbi:MAG: transglutaminase family protein, partial [Acidobacteria bacterium]